MEDTLRVMPDGSMKYFSGVLILVLMEDTLRGIMNKLVNFSESINPCFNGRYSQRQTWTSL